MLDGQHLMIGIDRSAPLAQIAASRAAHGGSVCIGDATYIPLRAGIFDAALSIAMLHHLSTRARRLAALRQLTRIVRPGGRILVYAWSQHQVTSLFGMTLFRALDSFPSSFACTFLAASSSMSTSSTSLRGRRSGALHHDSTMTHQVPSCCSWLRVLN